MIKSDALGRWKLEDGVPASTQVIYKKFTHWDKKDAGDGMQGVFLEAFTQSDRNGRIRYALLPMENVLPSDEILFIPFIPVNIFLISFLYVIT